MASSINSVPATPGNRATDIAATTDQALVLVGDAQRARIVRLVDEQLEILWEGYAATREVRALNQAPDINRNSDDAVEGGGDAADSHFVREASEQLHALADARPGQRVLVIAPRSFADALQREFGDAWPTGGGDVIHRDETKLDDEVLRSLIRTTLGVRR